MQKIVLDTNVIVSALIGVSHPLRILDQIVFESKVQVVLSAAVFDEYITVLNREKFRKYEGFRANSQIVLNRIHELAIYFSPSIKFETLTDESDNKFLELAFASSADFLVTGNIKDFKFSDLGKLKIVTPKEFMAQWQNENS